MSSYQRILDTLRAVRRFQQQRRLRAAVGATAWTVAIGVPISVLILAAIPSDTVRYLLLSLLAVALLVLWTTRFVGPSLRQRTDAATAELLESHFSQWRSDLSSSLEFGAALEVSGERAGRFGSPALMGALVDSTVDRLEKDIEAQVGMLPNYSTPRLRRAALVTALPFLVLLLASSGVQTGLGHLLFGSTATPEQLVAEAALPQRPIIVRLFTTYRYPSYARRESIRTANPTGRIEVLAGTEVTIDAFTQIEISEASLVLFQSDGDGETEIETEIEIETEGQNLHVRFTPLRSSYYTFNVVTPSGEHLTDPIRRSIQVIPDLPPTVALIAPDTVVQAGPQDVVPFRFAVSDDYGLTEVGFSHTFSGSTGDPQRQTLLSLNGELLFEEAVGFDLAPLNLQPRDEIVVHVEVLDNDTISGPKTGVSRPVLIRITSPEDRHLEIIARENEVFERLLTVLGDYLENPISDLRIGPTGELLFEVRNAPPDVYLETFHTARRVSQQVYDVLALMRELMETMQADELLLRRDYEIFESMYDGLYELHRNEQNVLVSLSRPAARNALTRSHMRRLEEVRQEQITASEQAILQLEELIGEQRIESLARTLEELDQIQQRLRELLEEYRDSQDPELRSQIEQELSRLEARMQELLQRLAEQMEQLPSEHYNIEALQERGMMGDADDMRSALEQIRDMLDANDIEAALEALDNLEAQIESMMQQMDQSASSGGGGMSELDSRMSELIDELNNLEAQESAIEESTAALQEEIRQRRIDALEEELEGFVEDARERVAQMQEELSDVDRERLRSDILEQLSDADSMLDSLDEMLESNDFEGSLDRAQATMERLTNAERRIQSTSRRMGDTSERGRAYQQAETQVGEIADDAQTLAQDLESLIERARPRPGPEDGEALQELAQQQQRTLQELSELMQQVEEAAVDMPMIGDETSPSLQRIQEHMEGAERELRGRGLQGARRDEQGALQELRSLRDRMYQMVQRERMGRRRQNQTVERVEIPEEASETPAEFRQDILDAMRETGLDAYRDEIRRYYESLVQ